MAILALFGGIMSDYSDHRAKELLLLTREVLKELQEVCS